MTWSYPRQTVAVVTVGQAVGHVSRYVISFIRQPPLTAFVPERGPVRTVVHVASAAVASPDVAVAVMMEGAITSHRFSCF